MRWLNDNNVINQLPSLVYFWAIYMKHGPKRRSGGTLGGSAVYRLCTFLLRTDTKGEASLVTLRHENSCFSICVDVCDFESLNHTIDLWLYGSPETILLSRLMRSGSVFMDVGANYGVYSLVAAHVGGASAVVYAFEPQKKVASALCSSIKINDAKNISLVKAAVTAESGVADFFVPNTGSGVGSIFRNETLKNSDSKKVQVITTTIDEFVRAKSIEQIDLVKIDVEGAELEVVFGARNALSRFHPVIWFEVNPAAMVLAGSSQQRLFSSFKSCGYTKFYDVEKLQYGYESKCEVTGDLLQLANVVAVPPSKQSLFNDLFFPLRIEQPN